MKKAIIYYTDFNISIELFTRCAQTVLASNLPVYSSSLNCPAHIGYNKVYYGGRGYMTMFQQILDCLERCPAGFVFFCEHDVLYHPSHFEFQPSEYDIYYYNNNVWKWNGKTAVKYDSRWLSQLCCSREIAVHHFKKKVEFEACGIKKRFEPGTRKGIDNYRTEMWESTQPNLDIRHGGNLTGMSRFNKSDFRGRQPRNFVKADSVPYWGKVPV